MKPRDIVLSQIQHKETELIPYTLDFEGENEENLDNYYGNGQWRDRIQTFMKTVEVIDTMKKIPTESENYNHDPYGTLWRMDLLPFHHESAALPNPSFEGYSWPNPKEFYLDKDEIANSQKTSRELKSDIYLIGGLGWGLFETSWGIRGFENVLTDIIAEQDFFEELLDRITDQFLAYIDFTCEKLPEVDAIMFGDDWGDQRGVIVGPERWRKFFKPRYGKIYEAVHKKGKYVISHSCGSVADIMPDIIEIGLDVLESVQPEAQGMNPYELKKKCGDKITFWGCLGSQSTIQFGTPAEIHSEVNHLRKEVGKGGGFILAPAKGLQPGTPLENAVAVVEAFTG
jgi:uroporphyrinogen decarboxylase